MKDQCAEDDKNTLLDERPVSVSIYSRCVLYQHENYLNVITFIYIYNYIRQGRKLLHLCVCAC